MYMPRPHANRAAAKRNRTAVTLIALRNFGGDKSLTEEIIKKSEATEPLAFASQKEWCRIEIEKREALLQNAQDLIDKRLAFRQALLAKRQAFRQALIDKRQALLAKRLAFLEKLRTLVAKRQALFEKRQAVIEKRQALFEKRHALNEKRKAILLQKHGVILETNNLDLAEQIAVKKRLDAFVRMRRLINEIHS